MADLRQVRALLADVRLYTERVTDYNTWIALKTLTDAVEHIAGTAAPATIPAPAPDGCLPPVLDPTEASE